MARHGFFNFVLGVGIGVGLGMLFSPNTGEENRRIVKEKAKDVADKIKNIDLNEVKDNLVNQYEKLKEEVKNMDAEKAKALVKRKATELSEKANEQ